MTNYHFPKSSGLPVGLMIFCCLALTILAAAPGITASSFPGPISWQTVMTASETWESDGDGIHMPWVVYEVDEYKMWYRVAQPSSSGSAGGKIAYADSTDGITWTNRQLLLESGAEFGPERSLRRPVVFNTGTEYRLYNTMYYTSPGWSLYVALRTCADGVSFGSYTSVLDPTGNEAWEYDSQNVRAVFEMPGGGYRMFYAVRYSLSASPDKYWATATSVDGTTWTNRSQLLGSDSQPLYCTPNHWYYTFDLTPDGTYRCFFSDGSSDLQIAESADGINWDTGTGGYMAPSVSDLSDALASAPPGAYGGCVVRTPDNGEYFYFYADSSNFRIGRFTLTTPVKDWNLYY